MVSKLLHSTQDSFQVEMARQQSRAFFLKWHEKPILVPTVTRRINNGAIDYPVIRQPTENRQKVHSLNFRGNDIQKRCHLSPIQITQRSTLFPSISLKLCKTVFWTKGLFR